MDSFGMDDRTHYLQPSQQQQQHHCFWAMTSCDTELTFLFVSAPHIQQTSLLRCIHPNDVLSVAKELGQFLTAAKAGARESLSGCSVRCRFSAIRRPNADAFVRAFIPTDILSFSSSQSSSHAQTQPAPSSDAAHPQTLPPSFQWMDVQIGFNIANNEALLVFVHSITECSAGPVSFHQQQLPSITAIPAIPSDSNLPPRMCLTICDPASDKVLFSSTHPNNDPFEASFNVPSLMSQFRQQVEASKTSEHRNYPQCFDTISCTDGTRITDDHFETRTALIGFGGLSFVLEQQTPIAAQPRINIARETLSNSSTSLSPPITPVDPSGSWKGGKRSSRPWEDFDEDKQEELTGSAGQEVKNEPQPDATANPQAQQDDLNGPVHKRNSIPSISDMLPSIQSPLSNWNSPNATQLPGLATTFPAATQLTFERRQSTYMEALPQIPSPSTTPQSIALHPQMSSQSSPHYNSGVHVHQPQPQRQQVHYLIQQLNNNDNTTSPNKLAQLPPHIHPAAPLRSSLSRNATYPPPPPQQHPTQTKARLVVDSNSPSPIRDDDDGSVLPVSVGKTRPLKDGDCKHCGIKTSREWRKGPHGAKTLCNACGLRYKRKPWDIPAHERAGIHN